jgi:hypothetical protein
LTRLSFFEQLSVVDRVVAAAFVQPQTSYWFGNGITGGFVRAFTPVVRSLGGLLTDSVSLNLALNAACSCLNNQVCYE